MEYVRIVVNGIHVCNIKWTEIEEHYIEGRLHSISVWLGDKHITNIVIGSTGKIEHHHNHMAIHLVKSEGQWKSQFK